ncbi:hypothetical protein CHCC20375_4130 [Bacillus licheniformis]|nr:hypothetical protein CHCC20375_4130 [Bacillus licheniformis]
MIQTAFTPSVSILPNVSSPMTYRLFFKSSEHFPYISIFDKLRTNSEKTG